MAPRSTGIWANRVESKVVLVPPDQLLANPLNARRHGGAQRESIRSSLSALGWIAPVLVNTTTGHVIDGHARIEEALTEGAPAVPVLYVELSEEEEALALATYDPIAAMATYDAEVTGLLLEAIDRTTLDEQLDVILADIDRRSGHAAGSLVDQIMEGVDVEAGEGRSASVLSGVTDVGDERRTLLFALIEEDYSMVNATLTGIRDREGFDSQGEALVWLCASSPPTN